MELLSTIERVTRKIAPGRAPSFTAAHIIKALELICGGDPVGRIRLSKELELGEGVTRTLVKHLKNEKIIKVTKSGIMFSQDGEGLFSDLKSKISERVEVPPNPLTVGPSNVAVLVRDVAHEVKRGLEQRDAAIKAGAFGATTLNFFQKRLRLPSMGEEVFKSIPHIHDLLVSKLNPKENDVIIIGSGEDKTSAEIGALMAAFELLKSEVVE